MERRIQRQLRDAFAVLLVCIPRQNIVVTASPGLSVPVLPESLDADLLIQGMLSTLFFSTCLYRSPILRIHSSWFAHFRYRYQGFLDSKCSEQDCCPWFMSTPFFYGASGELCMEVKVYFGSVQVV